jgi:hypothetical protein
MPPYHQTTTTKMALLCSQGWHDEGIWQSGMSFFAMISSEIGLWSEWIDTVMRCCVTSVKYVVRVNGELTELVIPTRDIKQGDPISPYLFLLCMEGLSCPLQQWADQGELQVLCNGRLGPPISHLLTSRKKFIAGASFIGKNCYYWRTSTRSPAVKDYCWRTRAPCWCAISYLRNP